MLPPFVVGLLISHQVGAQTRSQCSWEIAAVACEQLLPRPEHSLGLGIQFGSRPFVWLTIAHNGAWPASSSGKIGRVVTFEIWDSNHAISKSSEHLNVQPTTTTLLSDWVVRGVRRTVALLSVDQRAWVRIPTLNIAVMPLKLTLLDAKNLLGLRGQ